MSLVLLFVYSVYIYLVRVSQITSTCTVSDSGTVSSPFQQSTLQYTDSGGSYSVNIDEAIYE